MADMPSIHHPRAFAGEGEHPGKKQQPSEWDQRLQQQVGQLLELLDQHQPDVLLTYGPDGGYGHPDHIRAHDITHAAARQWHARRPHDRAESADPAYAGPQEILWMVTEREVLASELERVDPKAVPEGWRYPQLGDIASVPADQVDFRVRGSAEDVAAKRWAMSAHATQLWVADGSMSDANPRARVSPPQGPVLFCLSNLIAQPLMSSESWTIGWRAHPERAGASMLQRWLQETETRAECSGADGCKGLRDREVRQ
ncbi:hypothetical protein CWC39_01190 [Corynebacterium heidelbergense]|uniref:N-acetyl-1-D-myo-inositol-2-amino-2-deoxy-alpha-D-glucopyranoside deacetylase n=3 Tax=Corynebacterium heidelbergense TaxID=2055947 RepID=A0A364VDZ6_9CORY|nr:hypothetical protein CWC39_01190 [Corynebacterium heidelbergense]